MIVHKLNERARVFAAAREAMTRTVPFTKDSKAAT